jgi:fructose-1,6-bisphosphatase I
MKKVTTIERHFLEQQRRFPEATGAFTSLMYDIALAAKVIARETTRAGLGGILGRVGSTNVQGEEQQKLDVYADRAINQMLDRTGRVCIMASEEHEEPIHVPDDYACGSYAVLYDPLDGSSNIDYNVSIGTIFAVHRKISEGERGSIVDLLQPGYRLAAAGYVVFGSSTMLVYSAGQGVHGFTLDPSLGEFLLSHPDLRFPDTPQYYSVNQGYERYWTPGIRRYVDWLTARDPDHEGPGLSSRYIGSLVADFHRNLMTGGIFMYPYDKRKPDQPHGKLRLTYECIPLAFIAEQAAGYASDGTQPIRIIQPHSLHQRTPFFVGNRDLVERLEQYVKEYDGEWIEQYRETLRVAQDDSALALADHKNRAS